MADFQPFDLGKVLMTAQTIKSLRNQEQDDALRRAYMQEQISGAQQQRTQQAQTFTQEQQIRDARNHYLAGYAVETAADPIAAAKALAPDMVAAFEQQHGAGSFDQLPPEAVKQLATLGKQRAAVAAGITPKVKFIDAGGQQIAVDENTGQPISGISPIAKSASPDAQLTAGTALRGQDLSAQTSRTNNAASVAATIRGQDLSAETTRRGQDMTAQNQKASDQERTAANYFGRMQASEQLIGSYMPSAKDYIAGLKVMDGNSVTSALANQALSPDGQKYYQAAADWVRAKLRKESGAVISPSEMVQEIRTYFPVPGDTQKTIAQKQQARAQAAAGMKEMAGPVAPPSAGKVVDFSALPP